MHYLIDKANAFTLSFAGIGGVASFFIGDFDLPLKLLLTAIVLDYTSGVIAALSNGRALSSIGFKGILKKVFILLLVCVGHITDQILGTEGMFREMIVFFYFANEILSIIENAYLLGLPVPEGLIDAVNLLKNKGNKPEEGVKK